MSGPAPLQPQGPLILEALRLVEGASTVEATLATTPGAELKAVLTEISSQGLLLLLADGRSFTAAGKLPYPTGTELTFRIQPQADGSTQLQTLRANPPPPPALLAPLVQGEAASLLQRLAAPELPAELRPLKELLDRLPTAPQSAPTANLPPALAALAEALGFAPETPPASAPAGEAAAPPPSQGAPKEATPLPNSTPALTIETLTTALGARGIPAEPARALARLLLGEVQPKTAPPSAPSTQVQDRPVSASPEGNPAPPGLQPPIPTAATLDRDLLRAFGLPESLIRELLPPPAGEASDPSAPAPAGDEAARGRLKQVLDRLPAPLAQRVLALLTLLPPAGQGQVLARQDPLAQLIRSMLPNLAPAEAPWAKASVQARADQASGLQPSEPETWTRWLKEVTSTLSRPEASPAEAPFHRLQAREGTALFEVPLPWTPDPGTLELWAEREADGSGREEVHRVLLALNLGRTGELRVALQSGPAGVQAQVVASPAVAARLEGLLRQELGEPSPFPLKVRAAAELPPRPRALAGTGLQALG